MAKKIWTNANVTWDTDSDSNNPGWIVQVDEVSGDEITPMTYPPAPCVYHAPRNADTRRILRETAKWEDAELR